MRALMKKEWYPEIWNGNVRTPWGSLDVELLNLVESSLPVEAASLSLSLETYPALPLKLWWSPLRQFPYKALTVFRTHALHPSFLLELEWLQSQQALETQVNYRNKWPKDPWCPCLLHCLLLTACARGKEQLMERFLWSANRRRDSLGLVYRRLCRHHQKMNSCSFTAPFWDFPEGQW